MNLFLKSFVILVLAILLEGPTSYSSNFKGVDPADQPKIIELIPRNGSSLIATGLKELKIKFNMDMSTKSFSVLTPCGDSGLCYKNGFWQDKRTLVIRLDRTLKPNHKYEVGIGTKSPMYSADGLHLEPTWWRFDTL